MKRRVIMKRFFAVVLAFALVLCFAGCGKTEKKEFSRGEVVGNTYENAFLGLGVKLEESWVFFDDSQIAELNGYSQELLDDDFEEYLKNATVVYDMYAMNSVDSSNVNINFEKLTAVGEVQTANMKSFVSGIMPTVQNSLETAGCTDVSYELIDVKLGENSYAGAKLTGSLMGINFYQVLACIKCDGYVANVVISCYNTDTTQDILDRFYTVK